MFIIFICISMYSPEINYLKNSFQLQFRYMIVKVYCDAVGYPATTPWKFYEANDINIEFISVLYYYLKHFFYKKILSKKFFLFNMNKVFPITLGEEERRIGEV